MYNIYILYKIKPNSHGTLVILTIDSMMIHSSFIPMVEFHCCRRTLRVRGLKVKEAHHFVTGYAYKKIAR